MLLTQQIITLRKQLNEEMLLTQQIITLRKQLNEEISEENKVEIGDLLTLIINRKNDMLAMI